MKYFRVVSKYPGSEELHDDHVVAGASKAEAREYVNHRWSPAYGYEPGKAPILVGLNPISQDRAREMAENGAIDWT